MNRKANWTLAAGMFVTAGLLVGVGQATAAGSPETEPKLTITVYNYADIDGNTLTDAEKIASGIFQKAGVPVVWDEDHATVTRDPLQKIPFNLKPMGPSHLRLAILPRKMADRFGLPSDVAGVAPGTGAGRVSVYVFYDSVEDVTRSQREAVFKGPTWRCVTAEQILAEVIAHEIGHILLNLKVHTKMGIMRGNWDSNDIQDIAYGYLGFSQAQAAVIRAEVRRRADLQEGLEAPVSAFRR
jgi:hypothetical protein